VIWRRIEVDGRISLLKPYYFIQTAFGWTDAHLHEFKIHVQSYAIPSEEDVMFGREIVDERNAFLNRLLIEEDVFHYTYDLGNTWEMSLPLGPLTINLNI
jgi:hypothetical protein